MDDILRFKPLSDGKGQIMQIHESHQTEWAALYKESYATQFTFSDEESKKEWEDTFSGVYGIVWKEASPQYILEDKLVGSLLTVFEAPWEDTPKCPFIIELVVDPEFRQRGIATQLLVKAAEICKEAGKDSMALRVMISNTNARNLYGRLGFEEWRPSYGFT